jgi:hypothetical protein
MTTPHKRGGPSAAALAGAPRSDRRTGAAGPAGPANVTVVPGQTGLALSQASCPAGQRATGGSTVAGGRSPTSGTPATETPTGWQVQAVLVAGGAAEVQVFVLCAP